MRIVDCFTELFAYVLLFIKTVDNRQPSFEQVKTEIDRLVAKANQCLAQKGVPEDHREHAWFAVYAWVDEALLHAAWQFKDRWQREQLQRIHFNTTDAGEMFFERLNALGPHQNDVREIYYLCLALGFTGMFIHEGDDFLLDQLKVSNLKVLMGSSLDLPSLEQGELFPEAYPPPPDEDPGARRGSLFSPMNLIGMGLPVVLFGTLFLIYYFILSHIGANLISAVP